MPRLLCFVSDCCWWIPIVVYWYIFMYFLLAFIEEGAARIKVLFLCGNYFITCIY